MLEIFLNVVAACCFVGIVFIFYMTWRNDAIAEFRLKIIEEVSEASQQAIKDQDPNWDRFHEQYRHDLPTYDEMMRKFWVWPLEKFIPKDFLK